MSGAVGAGRLVWVRQGFERVSEKAPGGRDKLRMWAVFWRLLLDFVV